MFDALIVGSGPGGVHAALPLCEAGLKVGLVDFGNTDATYRPLVPSLDFMTIRTSDRNQHRYLLGDSFEGILLGDLKVGTKLTPPRLHVTADAAERLPVDSDSFVAHQSLAQGGLADAWGAGVLPFRDEDFTDSPVSRKDLEPHYRAVAERIGVAGGDEDTNALLGFDGGVQPPLDLDSNAETLLSRYLARKDRFRDKGFFLGRAPLAVCSRPHRGRGAHQYHDMDYWTDTDDSVYRPRYTLNELKRFPNFTYLDKRLALSFREEAGHTRLRVRIGQGEENLEARSLILAAGAIGSARLVLASLKQYGARVPILTNTYTYIPSLNFNMLGTPAKDRRSSLAQLSLFYFPPEGDAPVLSNFFSYRSLLTFKLLKETPLPLREGLRLMRSLTHLLGVVTVLHRDAPSPEKFCTLNPPADGGPDRLEIRYRPSDEERKRMNRHEKAIRRFYRRLKCWPLRSLRRTPGSSIHYAGTLPLSKEEKELTCNAEGRLFGTRSVHVADGSILSPLPSFLPTFTIMAHANRIGTRLAEKLKHG